MSTRRIVFGFLVCFSIAVFVGQTISQTRGYGRTRERSEGSRLRNMDRQQRQQELEQHKQQLEQLKKQMGFGKSEKESMEQVLRATEEQWKAIKPKLNKVRELTSRANVSIRLMCVGVGGGGSGMGGSSVTVNNGFGRGSMSGTGFAGSGGVDGGELVQKRGSTGGSSSRGTATPFKDTNSDATVSRIDGGWRWLRPSQHKDLENLNEGEKICEELFKLLEDKNSELEEIRQKMEALRKFRQEAKKELAIAQQELRQLVTPHQEAALVMMQLLD